MRSVLLSLLSCLVALPVWAERLGERVELFGNRYDYKLRLGEQIVSLEDYGYIAVERRLGDLVLLMLSTGGNACPGFFSWVHVTPGAERMTEPFGTCSDLAEVTWDSETVTVTLPSMVNGQPGEVAFVYDGRVVREVQLGLSASGKGPDVGADAWIGGHPGELVSSSEWDGALRALVGQGRIEAVRGLIVVASTMQQDGDWVAGSGCMPHECNRAYGAIAINRRDGRLIVALRHFEDPPELYGNPAGTLPAAIREVLQGR
jgi:hypothetical protein